MEAVANASVTIVRDVLDTELQGQSWTMVDKDGHVTLVDGDVDTLALAQAVVRALAYDGLKP